MDKIHKRLDSAGDVYVCMRNYLYTYVHMYVYLPTLYGKKITEGQWGGGRPRGGLWVGGERGVGDAGGGEGSDCKRRGIEK